MQPILNEMYTVPVVTYINAEVNILISKLKSIIARGLHIAHKDKLISVTPQQIYGSVFLCIFKLCTTPLIPI